MNEVNFIGSASPSEVSRCPSEDTFTNISCCISALGPSSHQNDMLAKKANILKYTRVGTGSSLDLAGLKVCGRVISAVRCPSGEDGHDLHIIGSNCKRLQCPTCYPSAVRRSARRISDRLEGMHGAWLANGVNLGKLKHIVFSPPQAEWTKARVESDGGKSLRAELRRHLKRYFKDQAYGGYLIFHGERKKHSDGSECEDKNCHRSHKWTWGPHFHYVGYGYFGPQSPKFHAETKWIYKNIGNEQVRDAYLTVHYQLTHAGIFLGDNGEQVGTGYWPVGMMANCKGGRRVLGKHLDTLPCEVCQRALHEYGVYDQKPDWSDDRGVHRHLVYEVEYYVTARVVTYLQREVEGFDDLLSR